MAPIETADQKKLRQLIEKLETRGIRKIFFIDEGKYKLNDEIKINEPNVALVGLGEVTLIKAKKKMVSRSKEKKEIMEVTGL